MRADARRNQARILDAARAQITAHGAEVSMDQIARAAGVAVGTLYRHYPTKTDLVRAILSEYAEGLLVQAEDAARSVTAPGEAMSRIRALLTRFLATASVNQAIKAAAESLDAVHSSGDQDDRARTALGALIAAAQADGDLRTDVTADDILLIMISAPTTLPEPARDRWLEICLAGIGAR